ncbi:MAG: hypothetical protein IIZ18_05100, partial [Ruminococcus sp.]|nr:hypothetical protein [Ruminococcus sp.]
MQHFHKGKLLSYNVYATIIPLPIVSSQAQCKLRQLDHPHVDACLRSLTLVETVLLPSLNRVLLGTEFSVRIVKHQLYRISRI